MVFVNFEVTCVSFARVTNTDVWQAIVARATKSRKDCSKRPPYIKSIVFIHFITFISNLFYPLGIYCMGISILGYFGFSLLSYLFSGTHSFGSTPAPMAILETIFLTSVDLVGFRKCEILVRM